MPGTKITLRTALATIVTLSAALSASVAAQNVQGDPFSHPCKSEGSNNCFWDAKHSGNGHGKSYVVTKSGQVFYFSPSMSADPKHPFTNK